MDETTAWQVERRLWLDGPDFYKATLHPDCIMAFPGMGPMAMGAVLDGLEGAPRWQEVDFADRRLSRPGECILVLGYAATGSRPGDPPYRCYCTSTYLCAQNAWRLVQHQQTLADEAQFADR